MGILSWLKRRRRELDLDEEDFQAEVRAHLAIAAEEKVSDGVHQLRPARFLAHELLLPLGREAIELGLLPGLAEAPVGLEPAPLHEAVQRRVERAGLDLQEVVGLLADHLANAVAVLRAPLEGPEHEHVKGALEQLEPSVF